MKKLIPLLLFLMLTFPGAVQSQERAAFERLTIEIWPEYDEPSALVIYRGILSPDTSLPAQVTFQIPARAGQPNAVAVRGADEQLISVQYERVVRGDNAEINFTATSEEIQFEYYDPDLQRDGERRAFTYRWPGNHRVRSASFMVQKPRNATDLEISPPFGESFQGSNGLTYFRMSETSLPLDEEFTIRLEYRKASDTLSIGDQPVQPSMPIEPRLSFSFQGRNLVPWLLGGVGLLLILGAGILYWRFGVTLSSQEMFQQERKKPTPVFSDQESFCPQCGSRTGENDRFCRVCGQKLREQVGQG